MRRLPAVAASVAVLLVALIATAAQAAPLAVDVFFRKPAYGFRKDENLFDFYGRVERFLAKYLGGSVAPPAAAAGK